MLKQLTRTNDRITSETIASFIQSLDVSPEVKAEMATVTPHNYVGI
jgi:adenylosuccinate lyase